MKRIDVTCGNEEHTFRTNNNGSYLFVGVSNNRQISCESGFDSLKRIKRAIRQHLAYEWEVEHGPDSPRLPRLTYRPSPNSDWRP